VIKVGTEISKIASFLAGVLQSAVSSPFLYNLYTNDQSTTPYTSEAGFADD